MGEKQLATKADANKCVQNKWIKPRFREFAAKPCGWRKKEPPQHWPGSTTKDEVLLGYGGEETHKKDSLCLTFLCPVSLNDPFLHFCAVIKCQVQRLYNVDPVPLLGVGPWGRLRWDRCFPCPLIHLLRAPLFWREVLPRVSESTLPAVLFPLSSLLG